jgi:hypothetical protein
MNVPGVSYNQPGHCHTRRKKGANRNGFAMCTLKPIPAAEVPLRPFRELWGILENDILRGRVPHAACGSERFQEKGKFHSP